MRSPLAIVVVQGWQLSVSWKGVVLVNNGRSSSCTTYYIKVKLVASLSTRRRQVVRQLVDLEKSVQDSGANYQ
jgi:hypothetical protein